MRKLRISFSLVVMMLLMGIFSISAFAAQDTKVLPSSGSNLSTDPTAGVDTNGSLFDETATTDQVFDNGITNANDTGKGVGGQSKDQSVIKSQGMVKNDGTTGNHRTHGEYQNNTNSCASCHQTHTASSKNLLFKDGVYTTCTACHDGTLGFYNVFEASTAGTFGGHEDASLHMANDSLTVSAAPGGNRTGTEEKSWGKEFNCASCHSPHGSYSDRLLNYNPNNMGATSSFEGGNAAWSKIYPIADKATLLAAVQAKYDADATYNPKDEYGKFILVKGTLTDLGITPAANETGATEAITSAGFSVDHGHWALTVTPAPILYAYEYASPYKAYDSRLFKLTDPNADTDGNNVPDEVDAITWPYTTTAEADKIYDGNDNATTITFNYQKGYITGTAVADANYGQIARAYVVKMDLKQYPGADLAANQADTNFKAGGSYSYVSPQNLGTNNFGGIKITYSQDKTLWGFTAGGKGIAMSNYCASCHTDYLASSGKATGEFSSAYRHTTEVDTYTCIRCHYAHGTERDMMSDAQGRNVHDLTDSAWMTSKGYTAMTPEQAAAWMDDKNSSSALKKFTNMSGCWSCHNSSHAEQLINNDNTTSAQSSINMSWSKDTKK